MGSNAFTGMCDIGYYNDRLSRFDGLEGYSNIIKFYCIDVNTKYGNEHTYYCKVFAIKKRISSFLQRGGCFRGKQKNDVANSLHSLNNNL